MQVRINGERYSNEEKILEQLREVKEDVVTSLCFNLMNFYGPRVRATIDVFRRVARLDRQIRLSVQGCSGSIGVIIKEALAVDSVSGIYFFSDSGEEHEQSSIFSALSKGMRFRHLQSIHIRGCTLTREQAEYLSDGLVTAAARNGNLKCLYFESVKFQDEEATSVLISGLRQNSTLQKVRFVVRGVIDAQVSQIVEALESNPSLRELYLIGAECGVQVQGMEALAKLVSKNRKLENLRIMSNDTLAAPIHPLLESLKGHPCLKKLELFQTGLFDADLGKLVEALSTVPRLETLVLHRNKLTHSGLELLVLQPLPSALRSLFLHGNDIDNEKTPRLMLRLLQDNPKLCSIVGWDAGAEHVLGGEIQHFKDLNKSGRILLGKDPSSVPLSLWPLVLERANGLLFAARNASQLEQDARRANAIFHLLQGPALMQRIGGDLVHKASYLSIVGQERAAIVNSQERPPKK